MRTKLLSWILLCGVAVFFAASVQAQQARVAGRIVVAHRAPPGDVLVDAMKLPEAIAGNHSIELYASDLKALGL